MTKSPTPLLTFDEAKVRSALAKAWSKDTAIQWTEENPASGQCNVTAAVIYDLFGGEILRTWIPDVWHYYNRIDGKRLDLTDSQFHAPGARFEAPSLYDDDATTRQAALETIPDREYNALRKALLSHL